MEHFLAAFANLLTPVPFLHVLMGTAAGVFVGAVPGLTGGMLIALTLPLTFYMDSTLAMIMLVGMYVGSVAGGLISATLLRMPGTPSSIMTTFDGYPMARDGRPERALGIGIGASFVGGITAGVILALLSPPLSRWATTFGPWEYFTMTLMAVVLIASLSQGSMMKGLLSGVLGMLVAMPGLNPADGQLRLTFGFHTLDAGFKLLPVLLGVFVMSQVIKEAVNILNRPERVTMGQASVFLRLSEWRRHCVNLLRSSVIGTFIGILPGVGSSISSMVCYATAKGTSKNPEVFGTGSEEGIVASEAGNNANVGGALVPLVTMGIPGSPIDAILLGALILHNLQPGPLLFINNPDIVWAMIDSYLLANVLMLIIMLFAVRIIAKVMYIDRVFLLPTIFVFCMVGSYSLGSSFFDAAAVIGFGILGYCLERAKIPLGPFVIGFVLAPILERELRSGLMLSDGSYLPIVTRPLALIFVSVSVALLLYPVITEKWRKRRNAAKQA